MHEDTGLDPRQLELSLTEARTVQHAHGEGWRGYATLNRRSSPTSPLLETRFPVEQMPAVIDEALKAYRHDHDLYVSQHSYSTGRRTTPTLMSLNIGHADLDIYKTDWLGCSVDQIVSAFLKRLEAWGIPLPSYIVYSGRGLQPKWIWDGPLPPQALPRWQVAMRYLAEEVLHDFGGDVQATLPTQIMRLVGSQNLRGGDVRIVWIDGGDLLSPVVHDFDAWCDAVLPFTRDQVREFKQQLRQYDAWRSENQKNLARLAAEQPGVIRARQRQAALAQVAKALDLRPDALAPLDDLDAGEIWQRRLDVMRRLLDVRGLSGVEEGSRHEWVWVAANGLAWVNREQMRPLRTDVIEWARRHIPTYTPAEVTQAAAAVLKRIKQPQGRGSGLYRMAETTFRAKLGITADELESLDIARRKEAPEARWNVGAMGFEPMRGLSYEDYQAETRRRQQEAAHRTNEMVRAARLDHQEKARQLRAEGLSTTKIANRLGVNQSTVSRWLRG